MTELTVQQHKNHRHTGRQMTIYYTVGLENFSVKKVRITHTSTKLKHTRFFTMKILPFK